MSVINRAAHPDTGDDIEVCDIAGRHAIKRRPTAENPGSIRLPYPMVGRLWKKNMQCRPSLRTRRRYQKVRSQGRRCDQSRAPASLIEPTEAFFPHSGSRRSRNPRSASLISACLHGCRPDRRVEGFCDNPLALLARTFNQHLARLGLGLEGESRKRHSICRKSAPCGSRLAATSVLGPAQTDSLPAAGLAHHTLYRSLGCGSFPKLPAGLIDCFEPTTCRSPSRDHSITLSASRARPPERCIAPKWRRETTRSRRSQNRNFRHVGWDKSYATRRSWPRPLAEHRPHQAVAWNGASHRGHERSGARPQEWGARAQNVGSQSGYCTRWLRCAPS